VKDGFYYLKTKDGGESPVLVYGYHCTDNGGVFGYGFNTHDGGGFLPHSDLTENSIVVPVSIVESQPAKSESSDGQSLRTTLPAQNAEADTSGVA
jgi:hypothetical protein